MRDSDRVLAFVAVCFALAGWVKAGEIHSLGAMSKDGAAAAARFDGRAGRPALASADVPAEDAVPVLKSPVAAPSASAKVPAAAPRASSSESSRGSGSPALYSLKTVAKSVFSVALFGALVGLIVGLFGAAPMAAAVLLGAGIGAAAGLLWGGITAATENRDNRWD